MRNVGEQTPKLRAEIRRPFVWSLGAIGRGYRGVRYRPALCLGNVIPSEQQPAFWRRPGASPEATASQSLDESKEPLRASALRDRQRRERRSIGGERIRGQPSGLVHRLDIGRTPGAQGRGAASKGVTLSSLPDVTQPHACGCGPRWRRHAFQEPRPIPITAALALR